MSRRGFGFGIRRGAEEAGGFSFSDADANAYYDALVVANGGDIDSVALYSIDLDTLKEGIQFFFIDAKSSGYYTGGIHAYLFIGGTAVTHAVNAITTTSELTYHGATTPTHSSLGVVTDAAQLQYVNINNNLKTEVSGGWDWSMAMKSNSSNSKLCMGSRDMSAVGAALRYRGGQTLAIYNNNQQWILPLAAAGFNNLLTMSRIGQADGKLYQDATEIFSDTNNSVETALPTTTPSLINAWSNGGTPLDHSTGSTSFAWIGGGLTATQVSDLSTNINTLDDLLGR